MHLDQHVAQALVLCHALHHRAPAAGRRLEQRHHVQAPAQQVGRLHAELAQRRQVLRHPGEAQPLVGLPVPVGGQLHARLPAPLALAQGQLDLARAEVEARRRVAEQRGRRVGCRRRGGTRCLVEVAPGRDHLRALGLDRLERAGHVAMAQPVGEAVEREGVAAGLARQAQQQQHRGRAQQQRRSGGHPGRRGPAAPPQRCRRHGHQQRDGQGAPHHGAHVGALAPPHHRIGLPTAGGGRPRFGRRRRRHCVESIDAGRRGNPSSLTGSWPFGHSLPSFYVCPGP